MGKITLTRAETLQMAKAILPHSHLKITIKYPCDLRASLRMKQEECYPGTWTAFINNAGTLVHMLYDGDDMLIRLPFKHSMKHLSLPKMRENVISKVTKRLRFI